MSPVYGRSSVHLCISLRTSSQSKHQVQRITRDEVVVGGRLVIGPAHID